MEQLLEITNHPLIAGLLILGVTATIAFLIPHVRDVSTAFCSLPSIVSRLTKGDERFDGIDARLDDIDLKIDRIEEHMEQQDKLQDAIFQAIVNRGVNKDDN